MSRSWNRAMCGRRIGMCGYVSQTDVLVIIIISIIIVIIFVLQVINISGFENKKN